jgi:N-sulfoglucosamine sulfohydrolase
MIEMIGKTTMALFAAVYTEASAKEMLNILLITGDDHGVQAGCYGDKQARTPNLDRLASEGTMFREAYVTHSSCAPSRASLMTGKFPHEHGQVGLAHLGYRLKPGLVTLPVLLEKAGYKTGIIGKHHIAPFSDVPFQWSRTSDYTAPDDGRGDTSVSVYERGRFIEDIAGFSGDFFRENRAAGKPFFLYVNYSDPHKPFYDDVKGHPEEKHLPHEMKLFDYLKPGQVTLEDIAGYYNSVARLDAGIGMLLDELDSQGLRETTLVVYLGDNGEPFPRAKGTVYQAGLQVPLLIDWPGKSVPGSVVENPVSSVSIFRTVLDAAGIETGDQPSGVHSLQNYLDGRNEPDGPVFAEFTSHGVDWFNPQRVVFEDGYKLIIDLPDSSGAQPEDLSRMTEGGGSVYFKGFRFYNVEKDPLEKANLAGNPELLTQIQKMMRLAVNWMVETDDPWVSLDMARAIARAHEQSQTNHVETAYGKQLRWQGGEDIQDVIPTLHPGWE